jgi:hypothetical protein
VRSALTDDSRPPLAASGLKLHDRLSATLASLDCVEKRGLCLPHSHVSKPSCIRA